MTHSLKNHEPIYPEPAAVVADSAFISAPSSVAGLSNSDSIALTRRLINHVLASVLVLLGVSLLLPQAFGNPLGVSLGSVITILIILLARSLSVSGHTRAAMLVLAATYWLILGAVACLAQRPVPIVLPVLGILPAVAMVKWCRLMAPLFFSRMLQHTTSPASSADGSPDTLTSSRGMGGSTRNERPPRAGLSASTSTLHGGGRAGGNTTT